MRDLRAVEELEQAGDDEVAGGELEGAGAGGIGGIEEQADEQRRGRAGSRAPVHGHEQQRDDLRHPAGAADALAVAFAKREADADGGGLADAERHHEGDRGQLQRDRVRSDCIPPDPALEQRGGGEQQHFGKAHEADGQADAQHLAQARPVGLEQAVEDVVAAEAAVGEDVSEGQRQHHAVTCRWWRCRRRRARGAGSPNCRRSARSRRAH